MAIDNELRPPGMTVPLTVVRDRRGMLASAALALVTMLVMTACGGTTVPPTADDAATIAAASSATPRSGSGGTRTPGASAAATGSTAPANGSRAFGGLLTPVPVRSTATASGTRSSTAGATRASTPRASATGAMSTPGGTLSPQSPALDPCTLVTPAQLTKLMGEPFDEFTNDAEMPSGMNSRLRGYSSASCTFAATASTQSSVRAVQLGTIRRTPASSPPTGSGTFATIRDVWTYIKMQAQGSAGANPSDLMGVGDEAFAVSDPDNPGDEDVFVRKGEVVLLVIVSGYDMGARDKAVAVASQAVNNL